MFLSKHPIGRHDRSGIDARLDPDLRRTFDRLTTPFAIQSFLDSIPYSAEGANRCPLRVIQDRKANCFDGALFAAAALGCLGHRPLIVDLLPEPDKDDDHMVAIFQKGGFWGSVAKSNFAGLRFREPIHRNLRELMITYFNDFYNVAGDKTLRAYTRPLDLSRFDTIGWTVRDEAIAKIENALGRMKPVPLVSPALVREFSPLDKRSLEAGLLGSVEAGLFKPDQSR
jgi:hypothetical protein